MYFISLQGAGNITHEILRLRSGSVRLINFVSQNQSLTDLKERARSLAVVTQNIEVGSMTIEEYVLMGRIPYHKPFQFFETKADIAITQKHMELTGVTRLKDKFMNALSGGEQQLAGIVRALTQEPELLLPDEPTSHLDITYQVTNFEFNQFGYYF